MEEVFSFEDAGIPTAVRRVLGLGQRDGLLRASGKTPSPGRRILARNGLVRTALAGLLTRAADAAGCTFYARPGEGARDSRRDSVRGGVPAKSISVTAISVWWSWISVDDALICNVRS